MSDEELDRLSKEVEGMATGWGKGAMGWLTIPDAFKALAPQLVVAIEQAKTTRLREENRQKLLQPLRWRSEPPKVEGYYWWRISDEWGYDEIGFAYQDEDGDDPTEWLWYTPLGDNNPYLISRDREGGEWAGPLTPPE